VALPSNNGILFVLHIYLAISFALYLGLVSDLYEESCSSSIMIIPIFFKGAKIADLAPNYYFSFTFFYFLPLIISFFAEIIYYVR